MTLLGNSGVAGASDFSTSMVDDRWLQLLLAHLSQGTFSAELGASVPFSLADFQGCSKRWLAKDIN